MLHLVWSGFNSVTNSLESRNLIFCTKDCNVLRSLLERGKKDWVDVGNFFFSILQLAFSMCKESHIFSSSLIITIKGLCQCVGSLLMFPVISFCFRFSVSLATFVLNGKRIDLSAWAMENNKCISVQFVFAVLIFS